MPCGYGGLLYGLLNLKGIMITLGVIAALYYGWPLIEKILLILPIPDPKSIKDKIIGMV
jgi:hypothetical protein